MPGAPDLGYVTARGALLDALAALRDQIDAVVVIGAQAVYLRTAGIETGLAALTLDADLAIDRRALSDAPLLENALLAAGMTAGEGPGTWHTASGVAVDIMLPRALADPGGQRGARMPPHGRQVARRTVGIEACVVDCDLIDIRALDPTDSRESNVRVAGPAGLIVAKTTKIAERLATPSRLVDKDAHDVLRLLQASSSEGLARRMQTALDDPLSSETTERALMSLFALASEAAAVIPQMAARAESLGTGEPTVAAASLAALVRELARAMGRST